MQFSWYRPILCGDRLRSTARHEDVIPAVDREGRPIIYILSHVEYLDEDDNLVAEAKGTIARILLDPGELLLDRQPSAYDPQELQAVHDAIFAESRSGSTLLTGADVQIGQALPPIVRGPLTMGDLIGWAAANGPGYRAGTLGYRDRFDLPQFTTIIPGVGWPVSSSQMHEDQYLNRQRGITAPFDNSTMRFSWASVLFTNWMGDHGFLQRLKMDFVGQLIYGDITWYTAVVSGKTFLPTGDLITIEMEGKNQFGDITTRGEADILLPATPQTPLISLGAGRVPASSIPIHQTIARHACETPHKTAVFDQHNALTFDELNRQAAQLAHYLRDQGVAPGDHVAIFLPRSPRIVVAILATLHAGAVFVPLDNALPPARLEMMCSDAAVTHILCETALVDPLPELPTARKIALDTLDAELASLPTTMPDVDLPDEALAYIMYTSGSTAVPKGVMAPHQSISRYVEALKKFEPLSADDIYLHTASFSFSAAMRQLLFPLACGVTLALASADQRRDPLVLLAAIRDRDITIWDTTPAFWEVTVERLLALQPQARRTLLDNALRLVMITGEALDWRTPNRWRYALAHPAALINLYSQTETCGTTAAYRLPENFQDQQGIVPLGYPLDGAQIFLLDEALQPVDPGEVAEVYVGGNRLAKGYLNRLSLTRESFIPNPYDPRGGILYHTGDLASQQSGGLIASHGRADRRVKIRGYRVELTAVETVLRRHPAVAQAVTLARMPVDGPQINRLHAFIVPVDPAVAPQEADLRAFAAEQLPDYMIPVTFTRIDALPQTNTGKVDLKTLADHLHDDQVYAPSADTIEQRMLAVWSRLLEDKTIGLDDEFFAVGGDSLQAIRLFSAIAEEFGFNLPLTTLLVAPSARLMADLIMLGVENEESADV